MDLGLSYVRSFTMLLCIMEMVATLLVLAGLVHFYNRWVGGNQETGPVIHTDEVDAHEFSRVCVVLSFHARPALVAILKASGNHVTTREMMLFRFLIGEASREALLAYIESRRGIDTGHEASILITQIMIVQDSCEKTVKEMLESREIAGSA